MKHAIGDRIPRVDESAFVAWNAEVAGDVTLKAESSVWFGATLRGDVAPIVIGERSNVQDGAVLHADEGKPCLVGAGVTIGHGAVVHAATVGEGSLVGMGAIILSGAKIGRECVVGAGALVTENKEFPDRSLIVGSPARALRTIGDEDASRLAESAAHYVEKSRRAKTDYREV